MLQTANGTAPAGDEETPPQARPASVASKLLPEIVIKVPTRTFVLGVRVIFGATVRGVFVVPSPRLPVTTMFFTPRGLLATLTVKVAFTTPPVTTQVSVPGSITLGTPGVIVQVMSPVLNPEPVTCTLSPPLAGFGEKETMGFVFVKFESTGPTSAANVTT
jgi:hypothetical protein